MKRILMAALAGAIMAGPAMAQWGPRPHPQSWNPNAFWRGAPANPLDRIQFLQDRINRGVADGSLNRQQAFHANRELDNIRQWTHSMHWQNGGQLRPSQRAQVQARLDEVSRQIRWMRHYG